MESSTTPAPAKQETHHILWFVHGTWWAVAGEIVTIGDGPCPELQAPSPN